MDDNINSSDNNLASAPPVVQPIQSGQGGVQPSVSSAPPQTQEEMVVTGGAGKEQKEAFSGPILKEAGEAAAETKELEVPPEMKEWMLKIEQGEEITLPGPITDDYGQTLVEAARMTKPQITLPLTVLKIQKGLHHKVIDSIRWLAEWCLRLIKMMPTRVLYSKPAGGGTNG